jgi:hypothetical protein
LYMIGRNIWIPFIFHFFWNFTHIVILGNERGARMNFSLFTWKYTDHAFTFNMPLIATYAILPFVIVIFVYLYFRQTKT